MNYLISEAAKKVKVESHVLRYWEEELALPIKRNELGHRYYTSEDIERFIRIKNLKEQGLQLKAIRLLLKDGKLTPLETITGQPEETPVGKTSEEALPSTGETTQVTVPEESREQKLRRMAELFKQAMVQAMTEVNEKQTRELSCRHAEEIKEAKEHILKELDYELRTVTEQNEERAAKEEEHFKKLDELLRKKQKKRPVE